MARDRDRDEDYTNEPPRSRRRDEEEEPRERSRERRRRDEEEDDRPRARGPRMDPATLRTVAWSQKVIILCILAYLATLPLGFALNAMPAELQLFGNIVLAVFYLAASITATVFVFMMAVKVYSTGVGVLLGLLTLIPCVGLIALLVINSKATGILQSNGVRVGLLGATMSDLP